MDLPVRVAERRVYYERYVDAIWKEVQGPLATQCGKYPIERVEIAPRFDGDIMVRNVAFRTSKEVMDYVKRRLPANVQLGSVFRENAPRPDQRALSKRGAAILSRVFVLDYDYDDTVDRTGVCECGRGSICDVCWRVFIEDTARPIIQYVLECVLGMPRYVEVFSGNRGMHVWVMDATAALWTRDERRNVMDAISAARMRHDDRVYDILKPVAARYGIHERECAFRRFYPEFDLAVSIDPVHLAGLPMSLHHATCYLRTPLPPLGGNGAFVPTRDRVRPSQLIDDAGMIDRFIQLFYDPVTREFFPKKSNALEPRVKKRKT